MGKKLNSFLLKSGRLIVPEIIAINRMIDLIDPFLVILWYKNAKKKTKTF